MISRLARTMRRVLASGIRDPGRAASEYWDMSAGDERIRDQSHWCGAGRWGEERWLAHGEMHRRLLEDRFRRFGSPGLPDGARSRALEWGSGGGALTRILCGHFATVHGVEISESTLRECGRTLRRLGHRNFEPVLIPAGDPAAVLDSVSAGTVDFILSVAVFQHFPSRAYTGRVLAVMADILKDGGLAFLQMRYSDGTDRYRTKEGEGSYAEHVITMTSFPLDSFRELLGSVRLTVLEASRNLDGREENHGYFLVRKGSGLSADGLSDNGVAQPGD